MANCTLHWTSDRGFELDLEAASGDVALSMSGVAVPADGTIELAQGVDLFPLDILFKSQVVIDGEPGQVQHATVRVADGRLSVSARVEDVETGEIVPFEVDLAVNLPRGVPERGGPKPAQADEDELDWEDETTLEKLVVEPGDKAPPALERASGDEPSPKALQALLRALMHGPEETDEVDLEDLDDDDAAPPARGETPDSGARGAANATKPPAAKGAPKAGPAKKSAPPTPIDQSISADAEARGLLELLLNGDNLELDGDHDLDELVEGVSELLSRPWPPEKKASRLSEWLLEQEAVADLFIADDDLAEILAQW